MGKLFNSFLAKRAELVESTDPDRIYIENVRAFFGITRRMAEWVCELAVREGLFERRISVSCPNATCGRVIGTYEALSEIPAEIECFTCSMDQDRSRFSRGEVEVEPTYRLVRRSTPALASA